MWCCVWFRNYPSLTVLEAMIFLQLYYDVSLYSTIDCTCMCPYFQTVQWSVIELLRIMLFFYLLTFHKFKLFSCCILVIEDNVFFLFVNISSCFLVVYRILFLKTRDKPFVISCGRGTKLFKKHNHMNGTWIVSVSLKCQILNPVIQPTHCMHAHLVLNLIIIKKEL